MKQCTMRIKSETNTAPNKRLQKDTTHVYAVRYGIQHHTMLWNGRLCVNSRRQTDRQSTGMSARNSSLSLVGNTFYCANSIEFVRTKNKNIRKNNNNNRGAAVRSNEFRMAMRHSLAMYQKRSLQLKKTVNGTKWCYSLLLYIIIIIMIATETSSASASRSRKRSIHNGQHTFESESIAAGERRRRHRSGF